MSANNPSHWLKGSGQKKIRAIEGSLWRVQVDLHKLERNGKTANGKTQAHYQEQLRELESNQETLQVEFSKMREEGMASTPKPVMPSPPTTPKQKGLAVLIEASMPRAFQCMALRDLLPRQVPEALGDTENPPSGGKPMFPVCRRWHQRISSHRKECSRPRRGSIKRTPQHFPGQRVKTKTLSSSEIGSQSMKS